MHGLNQGVSRRVFSRRKELAPRAALAIEDEVA
jgi:hypothetical protein